MRCLDCGHDHTMRCEVLVTEASTERTCGCRLARIYQFQGGIDRQRALKGEE